MADDSRILESDDIRRMDPSLFSVVASALALLSLDLADLDGLSSESVVLDDAKADIVSNASIRWLFGFWHIAAVGV